MGRGGPWFSRKRRGTKHTCARSTFPNLSMDTSPTETKMVARAKVGERVFEDGVCIGRGVSLLILWITV